MPRINTRKVQVDDVPRFCPNCGAANATAGLRCTICGHTFASADVVNSLWGDNAQNARSNDDQFEDLYSDTDPESIYIPPTPSSDTMSTKPYTPVSDPWSSSGGRLGADPSSGKGFVPPGGSDKRRRTGGPPGWLLGLVGILLILAVAGVAAYLVARPLASEEITDSAAEGIEEAVAEVTIVAPLDPGTIVLTEADVNRTIREHSDAFEPVRDIRVQIRRTGIEAQLSVFGVSTTLTGTLDVEDGKIVVVDPELSGIARRLVDMDDLTPRVEAAVNDLLARNNLEPTGITLSDDTITLMTKPATP